MAGHGRRAATIRGTVIPRRRFTGWAVVYFIAFVCVPVFAVAFALDYLLYALLIR